MKEKREDTFKGFSPKALTFLSDLYNNNNKVWFETHRRRYEEYLLDPLRNLVTDLGGLMLAIDPFLEISPAINKTISRIYRDTRFSKDKSPLRDRMWITFKRQGKTLSDSPAFFFEISSESYRYGMGFYSASAKTMQKFRDSIEENPKKFSDTISFYKPHTLYSLEGETYKRQIKNNLPPELQTWYQKRNFFLVCNNCIDDRLFKKELINDLISDYSIVAPLYQYLQNLKNSTQS